MQRIYLDSRGYFPDRKTYHCDPLISFDIFVDSPYLFSSDVLFLVLWVGKPRIVYLSFENCWPLVYFDYNSQFYRNFGMLCFLKIDCDTQIRYGGIIFYTAKLAYADLLVY